jgi:hypothetical protein
MKLFLLASLVFAVLAAAAYWALAVFFSANARAASEEAAREAARAHRTKKKRAAGA